MIFPGWWLKRPSQLYNPVKFSTDLCTSQLKQCGAIAHHGG